MISFALNEEQELIRDMLASFSRDELAPKARDADENAAITDDILAAGWELGLATSQIPEEFGGAGGERSPITNTIILEELGYGCASFASAIMSPSQFIQPLIDFGTRDQKREYLPMFTGSEFHTANIALQEPHFTFDPVDMKTHAENKNGNWIINGRKSLIPLGEKSSHFLVIARTSAEKGLKYIDAFIIPKDAKGLTITPGSGTQGLHALPMAAIELDNVEVPPTARLGGDTGIDGRRLINTLRVGTAALSVGVAHAATDYAIPYAREREAFGEVIGKKQAIAFMLSDMYSEVECMRWMVWKAASTLEQGHDATKETTLAKNYVSRRAVKVVDDALQVFGGHGFIRDLPLEMWLRNVRTLTVLEGPVVA